MIFQLLKRKSLTKFIPVFHCQYTKDFKKVLQESQYYPTVSLSLQNMKLSAMKSIAAIPEKLFIFSTFAHYIPNSSNSADDTF